MRLTLGLIVACAFILSLARCLQYKVNGTLPYVAAVSDNNNSRILLWTTPITSSDQAANIVLGQPDFYSNNNNQGLSSPTAATISGLFGLWLTSNQLFAADSGNDRVLVWNSIPTISDQAADFVLGQPTMNSTGIYNPNSALGFGTPYYITSDSSYLYVTDRAGARVLIWTLPIFENGQPPIFTLGQASLSATGANNGGLSAMSLSGPSGIANDGQHLYVADGNNNRVLIYNLPITANHQAANVVLGQSSFSCNQANSLVGSCGAGTVSSQSLLSPMGVLVYNGALVVADDHNNRVLIWSSIPTSNQQPASIVLGQGSMGTSSPNTGSQGLNYPFGVSADTNSFFVTDSNNHRVLVWNGLPTVNGQSANLALGQPDLNQNADNNGGSPSCPHCLSSPLGFTTNSLFSGVARQGGY